MVKEKENQQEVVSSPPTGMQVVWREFKKDKVAMFHYSDSLSR